MGVLKGIAEKEAFMWPVPLLLSVVAFGGDDDSMRLEPFLEDLVFFQVGKTKKGSLSGAFLT